MGTRSRKNDLNVASRKLGIDTRSYVYYNYLNSSKKREINFQITLEDFCEVIQKPCTYCGRSNTRCQPGNKTGTKIAFYFTGADRVDSKLPYIKSNVVPCCKTCNYAKNNSTLEEFNEWIQALVSFNKNRDLHDSDKNN